MTEKWHTYMYTVVVVRHMFGNVNIELTIVILFLADKTIEVVYIYFFASKRSSCMYIFLSDLKGL